MTDEKPIARWQVVENVVAAIERARGGLPGFQVVQKAMVPMKHDAGKAREVDVVVEFEAGPRTMRIGIDVKDEARPLDIVCMEQLISKGSKLSLDRYCVASTAGYTSEAWQEARRRGVELVAVEEFEQSDFWHCPPLTLVHSRQLEPLHVRLVYPNGRDPRLAATIAGMKPDDITMSNDSGSASLIEFVVHCGIQALRQNDLRPKDGEVLRVEIPLQDESTSYSCGEQSLPRPDSLLAIFRCHVSEVWADETRFRSGNIEAVTHQQTVAGEERQITLMAETLQDGRKQLKLSVAPANPKKTKL